MIPPFPTLHPVLALPGPTELYVILAVLLLFFGGRKLPELARSMGSSITQFRKGLKEAQDEVDDTKNLVEKDAPTSDSKE